MDSTLAIVIILILLIPVAAIAAFINSLRALDRARQAEDRLADLQIRHQALHAAFQRFQDEIRTSQPATAPPTAPPAPEVIPKAIVEAFVEKISPAPEPPPIPAPEPQFTPEPEAITPPPPIIPEPPIIPPLEPPPIITPAREPVLPPLNFTTKARVQEPVSPPPIPDIPTSAVPPLEPAAPAEKASFEMQLGTYWLVRVGVVMLLTGLAFFSNYAYHHIIHTLGPGAKVSLLYLFSGLLLGAGAWWQRQSVKESLRNYGQVLFAGGLAAVYFTTYAAYHIPPLQVITNALVDGLLLIIWAGVIAWIADRRKSEVMALFAIGLAFYSSVITHVGEFTLYSNLVLTLAAVLFLIRNRWVILSFVSVCTTYGGYAFWRFLHDDGWRWATADENLRLGVSFLACYWLIFTVATFMSRSEKLTGPNRAAFLTMNNGAFFTLYLLTMLQTNSGTYWEFSLIYGSILLGLAALAAKLLPAEPFAKNSYLTQGLVLVTLGFITKYSGLRLALILGVESITLFMIATQRRSLVMRVFAYAAALLATGWIACTSRALDEHSLLVGSALGFLMAVNAIRAHLLERAPESERAETTVFTLLAFANWTAAAWFYTTDPHLPAILVLAAESLVLANLVARAQSMAPRLFAHLAALGGVIWYVTALAAFNTTGLTVGVALGAALIFNAWRAHFAQPATETDLVRPEPTAFTVYALATWLAATWQNTAPGNFPLALALETVALTASIYLLRVPEIPLLAQFFLITAQVSWLFHFQGITAPWWNPLTLIVVTIALSHWWQKQKLIPTGDKFVFGCQTIFSIALVLVALVWLHPLVTASAWLTITSLLAVAATVYGVLTRAWPLALCGQAFLYVSAFEFFVQIWENKPVWIYPLAPIAVPVILSFATIWWFTHKTDGTSPAQAPLLKVALVYRWTALAMSLCWLWQYVPDHEHAWAYMAAAAALFAFSLWRRNREALVATAIYATVSIVTLWNRDNLAMDLYWANAFSLLALFAMQQTLRRCAKNFPLDEKIHAAVVLIAGISLWRFISCWADTFPVDKSRDYMTMIWAAYAILIFGAGLALRERFYRWFGLILLAADICRVVADIWMENDTIYRVVTIMALGLALVVIGFIYNKFQEKIRQWL